jgi:glycosyltransferase involved in cell wall biosynthesis
VKVALVHDWLNQYGGAERVLEVLHDLFPEAPIYTSIYEPAAMPAAYRQWDIRTSFMQSLPLVKHHHQPFMPLYPLAFEQFDLTAYDLVISNSSAFCHGVLTPAPTLHICYCLTPTRFVWNFHDYVREESLGGLAKLALPPLLAQLRLWDRLAADRVNHFIAISRAVAGRIAKYYRRDSAVIFPPVDCSSFQPADDVGDYFLVVSRLIPYKRVELAVRACSDLGLPLVVAGDGRYRAALERIAKPSVRFLGWVDEARLRDLYAHCRALIFPGEEDFGLTPLEAQASGRPVVAYAGGGALDTVMPGVTGEFFAERSWEALAEVLLRFRAADYDPAAARHNALRFEVGSFKEQFRGFVEQRLASAGSPASGASAGQ